MGVHLEERVDSNDKSAAVRIFASRVHGESLRLLSSEAIDAGAWVAFQVTLREGDVLLEGMGRCQDVRAEGDSFLVHLGALDFDTSNAMMFERLQLEADSDEHTGEVDLNALEGGRSASPPKAADAKAPAKASVPESPSWRPPAPVVSKKKTKAVTKDLRAPKKVPLGGGVSPSGAPPAPSPDGPFSPSLAPTPPQAATKEEEPQPTGPVIDEAIVKRLEALLPALRRTGSAHQVEDAYAFAAELGIASLEQVFGRE
ncbi:MAG: hypothetical protein AAF938_27420 [Myxococcota bacterium]